MLPPGDSIMSVARSRVARPTMAAVRCICVCSFGAVERCQRGPLIVVDGRRGSGEGQQG